METLTAQQAKQVIEYFAQQAAEDMPDGTAEEQETHLWMTRFQASLAVERQIGAWWWEALVEAQSKLQSFDRDPAGWLYDLGIDDSSLARAGWEGHLKDNVSGSIDNCWNNSGA